MPPAITERLQHAWNVLRNRDPVLDTTRAVESGPSSTNNPFRVTLTLGNERSIIASLYNRIAIDVAAVQIQHSRIDVETGRYLDIEKSTLNDCLSVEANMDQTGRSLIQDIVLTMFDEGCVAVVPVDTSFNPSISTSYDILSLRTAKILEWYPASVKVRLYNDKTGRKEEIILPKKSIAIIENPLYAVMNEPNSTLKRLVNKLNLLDAVDVQSSSGKLDLIIQLPYTIKSEARKKQAEDRKKDIEFQMSGSKYGIAYIDGTEKVTQLNRPAENNLMQQIEYLTSMLHSQLGMTQSIFDGTADDKTMINYHNTTIDAVLSAIVGEFKRKFLTKSARTQGQSILYFRDPFRLMSVTQIADTADKLVRNEICSPNDIRSKLGFKPDSNPKSDELRNPNVSPPSEATRPGVSNQAYEPSVTA